MVVLDAINIFVGEFFGGNVSHAGALGLVGNVLADGVKQVRFSQTDAPVEEQRVVGLARRLRHRQRGGISEVVVVADDERIKSVFRVNAQLVGDRIAVGRGRGSFGFCGRRRADRRWGSAMAPDFEFDLELVAAGQRNLVLQQFQIIIFEPDLAKIVGDFERQAVLLQRAGAQTREP